MSEIEVRDELTSIIQNVRLDTALRVSGIQKALDKRDDVIEIAATIAGMLSAQVDDAIEYIVSSEELGLFETEAVLEILRGAQTKSKEILDRVNKPE